MRRFLLLLSAATISSPAAAAAATTTDATYDYLVDVHAACAPATGDCLLAFTHEHGFANPVSLQNGALFGRHHAVLDAPYLRPAAVAYDPSTSRFQILSADGPDVVLHHLATDGTPLTSVVLDSTPTRIEGTLSPHPTPGAGTLAVWSGTAAYAGDLGVVWVRLAPDGTPAAPVARLNVVGARPQAVAIDTGWVIAWSDGWAVHALAVSIDGSSRPLPDPVAFRDNIAIGDAHLATLGNQPIVIWDENDGAGSRVMAVRVALGPDAPTAAVVIDAITADPASPGLPPWVETVVADPRGLVIGWNVNDTLRVARLAPDATLGPTQIAVAPAYASARAELVWDGTRDLVIHPEDAPYGGTNIVATPLSADLAPAADEVLVEGPPAPNGGPTACAIGAAGRPARASSSSPWSALALVLGAAGLGHARRGLGRRRRGRRLEAAFGRELRARRG